MILNITSLLSDPIKGWRLNNQTFYRPGSLTFYRPDSLEANYWQYTSSYKDSLPAWQFSLRGQAAKWLQHKFVIPKQGDEEPHCRSGSCFSQFREQAAKIHSHLALNWMFFHVNISTASSLDWYNRSYILNYLPWQMSRLWYHRLITRRTY